MEATISMKEWGSVFQTKMKLVKLQQHQEKIKENSIQTKLTTTDF